MNKFIITGFAILSTPLYMLGHVLGFVYAGILDGWLHEDKWRKNFIYKVRQEMKDEE